MIGQLIVQASEMLQAVAEMNQAMDIYREAVDSAKAAAADLASKWEGAAKDAFVAHQENAYNWHVGIMSVVNDMLGLLKKVIDTYNSMEDTVKSIVQG